MKKIFLTLTLSAGALLGATQAKAQSLPSTATNLRYNINYLFDLSSRVGDYGYAMDDLSRLNSAAERFSYTLNYSDYRDLRYAYDTSMRSWNYLRSYSYEPRRYADVQRDMSYLSSMMERPLPPPPPPPPSRQIITVRGDGSGKTTHGDRGAACDKATDRALGDVVNACSDQRGSLLSSTAGGCSCHKEPRSKDDYVCRVIATGSCEVFRRF